MSRRRNRCLRLSIRLALCLYLVALHGCKEGVLLPAGPKAHSVENLWWLFFAICGVVYAAVLLLLVLAVRRTPSRPDEVEREPTRNAGVTVAVVSAAVATVVLLFVLTAASYWTGRALAMLPLDNAVHIRVTGWQWWWELRYDSDTPAEIVSTANEMHVPIGRPIVLQLNAGDVIHSFWIPNIDGKKDLIPGRPTSIAFRVDQPGTYRGQCAEFCGMQHAHMSLLLIAQPQKEFDDWLQHERSAAAEPQTPQQSAGRQVFLSAQCPMCHRISGTNAAASVAPDLTHIAARQMLAAGTLPNTRGHRAGWVIDPQGIKPGAKMPLNQLAANDLESLLDYLDSLR